jgi:arabinofuranosyltransferase
VALVGLYVGWRAFWFLCDDAYIAFRYVQNSQLGHGYVWNAPPFLPVEGYTCFLWVVLLDLVWSVFGVEPPVAANGLGLLFAAGYLLLTARMTQRLPLAGPLAPHRTAILALVMAGLVTNACFLVWTSSGLETSLFNFLLIGWASAALFPPASPGARLLFLAGSASLLALTRPDGMLFLAATLVLLLAPGLLQRLPAGDSDARPSRGSNGTWRHWPFALPLLLPLAHAVWRRSFYGEWLPNTYYAKYVAAWPASGIRYVASFALEYGLWLLAALALWLGVVVLRSGPRWRVTRVGAQHAIVVATLVAHVAYYTFVIGGDHFEYRVYSHLPGLWLVAAVFVLDRLCARGALHAVPALSLLLCVVLLSWPIPWIHWSKARALETREETFSLTIPMAEALPPGLRWYGAWFDRLQHWLIVEHAVGKRHREHQVFLEFQRRRYPGPRLLDPSWQEQYPVLAADAVGVPGWVLARANVIDVMGLNDYVVARSHVDRRGQRRMAHDRRPPPGYLACFRPNVTEGPTRVLSRRLPMTADAIEACEERFRSGLVRNEKEAGS